MKIPACCFAVAGLAAAVFASGPSGSRTVHLRQSDAQVRFSAKVYPLKYADASAVLPFVNSAIKRYHAASTVKRVTNSDAGSDAALLVSTGEEFFPYVDEIVAALDRSGGIESTGVANVIYAPKYRGAESFQPLIDSTIASGAGKSAVNAENNTVSWRDTDASARRTLSWVQALDQPLPQARIRFNYYELRDSDLTDWGFDYLAWKNGPGVNLFNVGYNAGEIVMNELLDAATFAATSSWGMGGMFTAPQFDMSFIRCLQQSGNANVVGSSSLRVINTPVASNAEYELLKKIQLSHPGRAPFIYRIAMEPEYQNISKNLLGRTVIGKSFYEDEDGVKHSNPPAMTATIVNPFICFGDLKQHADSRGFIPKSPEFVELQNNFQKTGGVMFDYSFYFKNAVERGNTGAELSNSAVFSGAATLAFGREKVLAVYDKENDIEQTIGIPILCRIPVIKYLFSTTTNIKERTYIVVTAEAIMVSSEQPSVSGDNSVATGIKRRIEKPLRWDNEEQQSTDGSFTNDQKIEFNRKPRNQEERK